MTEINLFSDIPTSNKVVEKGWRKEENKLIAKRYDREFFDGERINGYGGYTYDGRWKNIVRKLQEHYHINEESSVLDVGCAKGFLLYDLQDMISGIRVAGLDISNYAINHAMDGIKNLEEARRKVLPYMIEGTADRLPWADNSFDVVLSFDTVHNLPKERCVKAIEEISRVCRDDGNQNIKLDAYRNEEEFGRMKEWILTGETALKPDEWINLFKEYGYKGDYCWTLF